MFVEGYGFWIFGLLLLRLGTFLMSRLVLMLKIFTQKLKKEIKN